MKLFRAVTGIVAVGFVFGPAGLWIGGVRPQAFENRPLAQAPSVEHGWNAVDDVAPWASDHLPGRLNAVRTNAWISYYVLGELPTQRDSTSIASPASVSAGQGRVATPQVVRGKKGFLFYGNDFDAACENGRGFKASLQNLAKLARVITSSGRRVVFTVTPNKSSVTINRVPRAVPRGQCALRGLRSQNAILDADNGRQFVTLRPRLAREHAAGRQVFWKTDSHWTTAGSALYARELARKLSPRLVARMRITPTRVTAVGDLMRLVGLTFKETARSARVRTGGAVRELPSSSVYDPLRVGFGINRWATRPRTGLVQGRVALVGDSYSYAALGTLRPLFAQGEFLWFNRLSRRVLLSGLAKSNVVVLQVVQRALDGSLVTRPSFRAAVAARLGVRNVR